MVALLIDLQVAEAKVKNLKVSVDSARHVFSIYELQIFDKHNVTPEKYLHSYQYYLDNHRLMSRVHQAVLDTLMERQRKAENMPPPDMKPKIQNDTLAARQAAAKDSLSDSTKTSLLPPDSLLRRARERKLKKEQTAPVGQNKSN